MNITEVLRSNMQTNSSKKTLIQDVLTCPARIGDSVAGHSS